MWLEKQTSLSMRLVVSYAVGALLFWVFVRGADWSVARNGLGFAGWSLIAMSAVVRLASLVVASLRWQVLLAPVKSVALGPLLSATMKSMTINAVISTQASELARPYFLSKSQSIQFTTALATVAAEWVLDPLGIVAVFIPSLLYVRISPSITTSGSNTIFSSGLSLVLALTVARSGFGGMRRLVRHILPERLRQRIVAEREAFSAGLQTFSRPKDLVVVSAYTMLISCGTAISVWFALIAFGLPVSFVSGFLLLGLVAVAGLAPTPGAVGGFHAVCQFGLVTFFHVDRARTVVPVTALHAVLYALPAVIGGLCFFSPTARHERNPS